MLYSIKKRNSLFLTSLLFSLSLVLVLGAQENSACGGCPFKKSASADKEAGTHNCPYHSNVIHNTESQTYTCPMHPEATSDKPGNCDKCGMKLVLTAAPAEDNPITVQVTNPEAFKKVERYVCPMHSEVVKKKGGNCPECGMKLEKKELYEVYICPMEECPHISEKAGKCCGMKMDKKLMSSEEFEKLTQLPVEYICPMHPEVTSNELGNCPKCGMKLEKQVKSEQKITYLCPMHPEVSSEEPGNCSKCGMKLKKSTNIDEESSRM